MDAFEKIVRILPPALSVALHSFPMREIVQELRFYCNQPIVVSARGKQYFLSLNGGITDHPDRGILCKSEWITQIFDRACDYSVYAHQHELCKGYVTTKEGIRIGIAGTAVRENGRVISFRDITSLCIRISREHLGCSIPIVKQIINNGIHSALICGEPSCGKTSLLKDLIVQLSKNGVAVSVVDERGELSTNHICTRCDLLRDCPKAIGVELAVRSLAPQIIVLDELGEEDIQSVTDGCYRAVPTVATVHCRRLNDLLGRPRLFKALQSGVFLHLFLLKGRDHPGEIAQHVLTEEWLNEMDRRTVDPVCRHHIGRMDAIPYEKTSDNTSTEYRCHSTAV